MQTVHLIGLLFFLSELLLLLIKRSRSGGAARKEDRHSLLVLWLAISISMSIGMGFALRWWIWMPEVTRPVGVVLAISGMLLRWISILQLGKMFTVDIAITDRHALKTNGLYRYLRHPSYTGLLLIVAGLGLATGSLLSLVVVVVPIFLALQYRIRTEETVLLEEFGDAYRQYCTKTYRLLPGIY